MREWGQGSRGIFGTRGRLAAVALAVAGLLAACGGSDEGQEGYGRMISFGDSLSDVGTYATPGLVAATGGGRYTVNGAGAQIWVERVASAAGVSAPCAAQVGLNSIGPFAPYAAAVTTRPGCYAHAQGGSRVNEPVGPGNLGTLPAQPSGAIGQLTVPVTRQMANQLAAAGGVYAPTDLVTVLAGANDLFVQMGVVQATVGAGGDPAAAGQAAGQAMAVAAGQLATAVKTQVVGKGARRVVVLSMPDVSLTPDSLRTDAATRGLIRQLSQAFNAVLQQQLASVPEVLFVDSFAALQAWTANPASVGLSNVSSTACNPALAPSSLFCTAATVVPGDVSRYLFADGVHPSPYGHELVARTVVDAMRAKGWL